MSMETKYSVKYQVTKSINLKKRMTHFDTVRFIPEINKVSLTSEKSIISYTILID